MINASAGNPELNMDVDLDEFQRLSVNNSQSRPCQDINILLLGETGVGKSTFINAIANYLFHTSFNDASYGELLILAPTLITLTNKENEPVTINLEPRDASSRKQRSGDAGTLDVQSYCFPLQGTDLKLNLIDSPGMGDPRGLEQDEINIEKILSYLMQFEELHAICFVMKPTTTRSNVLFEYSINQLLSRLETSASQNIIFLFTNTRGSYYKPGETFPCLRKMIQDIRAKPPYINIPFENNIFCFDNEAFKYLAAIKRGVSLSDYIIENCTKSWDVSFEASKRLISYIIGDGLRRPLPPHQLKNTVEINRIRNMIEDHSQPLVDVCQLIADNMRILEEHKDKLTKDRQDLDELKDKLYIPIIRLDIVPLEYPALICNSSKCAKYLEVNGVNQRISEQVCHYPCILNPKRKFTKYVGNILRFCHKMSEQKCTVCLCHTKDHRQVRNLKRPILDNFIDESDKTALDSKEKILEKRIQLIESIESLLKNNERELDEIVKSVAEFACFLENNSILPFTDDFAMEIKQIIDSCGHMRDRVKIEKMKNILSKYEEAKLSINKSNSLKLTKTSPGNIEEIIEKLYDLEINGNVIKELFEKQKLTKRFECDDDFDIADNFSATSHNNDTSYNLTRSSTENNWATLGCQNNKGTSRDLTPSNNQQKGNSPGTQGTITKKDFYFGTARKDLEEKNSARTLSKISDNQQIGKSSGTPCTIPKNSILSGTAKKDLEQKKSDRTLSKISENQQKGKLSGTQGAITKTSVSIGTAGKDLQQKKSQSTASKQSDTQQKRKPLGTQSTVTKSDFYFGTARGLEQKDFGSTLLSQVSDDEVENLIQKYEQQAAAAAAPKPNTGSSKTSGLYPPLDAQVQREIFEGITQNGPGFENDPGRYYSNPFQNYYPMPQPRPGHYFGVPPTYGYQAGYFWDEMSYQPRPQMPLPRGSASVDYNSPYNYPSFERARYSNEEMWSRGFWHHPAMQPPMYGYDRNLFGNPYYPPVPNPRNNFDPFPRGSRNNNQENEEPREYKHHGLNFPKK